jgi:hypothetical protein
LYRTSVVPFREFTAVQEQALALSSSRNPRLLDEAASIAVGRKGVALDGGSPIVATLDRHVQTLLRRQTGLAYHRSPHLPVELRVYQRGASMTWHLDDIMYDPPQIEVVFTLENNSDCVTRWKSAAGKELAVETDPNSVLALEAGEVWHCVTSLKFGRRVIVKMAYVLPGARPINLPSLHSAKATTPRSRSLATSRTRTKKRW